MKRLVMSLAVASSAGLIGCGGGEVVVEAQLAGQLAGEGAAAPMALEELEIRLLPYDRDQIFDSLTAAYAEPQPPIPDSLLQLQESVASTQAEWQEAENAWSIARDSLQQLSQTMEGLDRSSARYQLLFEDFAALEQREQALRSQMDDAFARFTAFQEQFANRSQEVRAQREQWADQAFGSIDSVITARLEALGHEELTDTTNAAGIAPFEVPPGQWWVHARYDLPYQQLYWNIPVEVSGGDSLLIQLTPETAETRSTM